MRAWAWISRYQAEEDLPQPVPHLHQATGRKLELEMEVEHVDDLGQSGAQRVVEPGREDDNPQADGRAGQGVGHDRLDGVAALRAPVAMDRVLGHHRRDVGGNVFDDPGPRRLARTNRTMALGTGRKLVILPAVDPRRRWSTMSRMSRLGTFGFGPPLAGSLDVRRSLSRRCQDQGNARRPVSRPVAWPRPEARRRPPPGLAERSAWLARRSVPDRARTAKQPHREPAYPWSPYTQFIVMVVKRQDQLNSAEVLQRFLHSVAAGGKAVGEDPAPEPAARRRLTCSVGMRVRRGASHRHGHRHGHGRGGGSGAIPGCARPGRTARAAARRPSPLPARAGRSGCGTSSRSRSPGSRWRSPKAWR